MPASSGLSNLILVLIIPQKQLLLRTPDLYITPKSIFFQFLLYLKQEAAACQLPSLLKYPLMLPYVAPHFPSHPPCWHTRLFAAILCWYFSQFVFRHFALFALYSLPRQSSTLNYSINVVEIKYCLNNYSPYSVSSEPQPVYLIITNNFSWVSQRQLKQHEQAASKSCSSSKISYFYL